MNKTRLENLSDGVFAIVVTILVLELRIPEMLSSETELWEALHHLVPLFIGYFISFTVLAMFWISHNALYGLFVKNINRQMVLFNMVYLAFASLVPFSTQLMSNYIEVPLAVQIYGVNIFILGLINIVTMYYALASKEIDTDHVTERAIAQARIRMYMTPIFTILGIAATAISIPLALGLYAFPIVFNVIPGTLDKLERFLGIKLGNSTN